MSIAPKRLADATWRKSSFSQNGGNCVEVANLATGIAVRDSKNPDGPVLAITPASWSALVQTRR